MSLDITIRTQDIERTRVWNAICDKLQERGLNINFVTLSKECHNFLTKESKECIYLADELDKYDIEGNPSDHVTRFEEKYDITSAEMILFGDLEHSKLGREKAYAIMASHFYFWDEFFQKNDVDFIFGGTERFVNMIPREVAKKYGVQDAQLTQSPIPGRSCVTTDVYGHFSLLDEYWEENKDKPLTKEERERSAELINSFRHKSRREIVRRGVPKISRQKIRFFLDRLKTNLFVERGRYPYVNILGGTYKYILRLFRARLARRYYSKFNSRGKYVFYPLQMSHEAQLTVRAPQHSDQVRTVKNISRSLPAGYRLYVKEHPNLIGGTPLEDLKNMKNLPNVKLIPPPVSSLKIIENSACVVTVNSTVGWEAMLLKKPVVNLGRVFYEISGLTYSLRNLRKLPEVIDKAMHENPVEEKMLIRFVNAIIATSFPGDLGFASIAEAYYGENIQTRKALQEENIENLSEGMYNQMKQIKENSK